MAWGFPVFHHSFVFFGSFHIGSLVIRPSCSGEEHIGRLAVDGTLWSCRLGLCRWRRDARLVENPWKCLGPVEGVGGHSQIGSKANMIPKWGWEDEIWGSNISFETIYCNVAASTPYLGDKPPKWMIGILLYKPHQNEPQNKTCYFPWYWLFNRDPHNGLLESLHDWVSPIYTEQHGALPFFIAQMTKLLEVQIPKNHFLNRFSVTQLF